MFFKNLNIFTILIYMCKESPALKQYVNLIEISIGSAMVFCRLLRTMKTAAQLIAITCGNKPNNKR